MARGDPFCICMDADPFLVGHGTWVLGCFIFPTFSFFLGFCSESHVCFHAE